jgi:hypothetical protein
MGEANCDRLKNRFSCVHIGYDVSITGLEHRLAFSRLWQRERTHWSESSECILWLESNQESMFFIIAVEPGEFLHMKGHSSATRISWQSFGEGECCFMQSLCGIELKWFSGWNALWSQCLSDFPFTKFPELLSFRNGFGTCLTTARVSRGDDLFNQSQRHEGASKTQIVRCRSGINLSLSPSLPLPLAKELLRKM